MTKLVIEERSPLIDQLSGALLRLSASKSSNLVQQVTELVLDALGEGKISVSSNIFIDKDLELLREASLLGGEHNFSPFIESDGRIYLARYYHYTRKLKESLISLATPVKTPENFDLARTILDRLFPEDAQAIEAGIPNWQKVAAALALLKQFCVISGGPGTGKTTTVLKLLASIYLSAEQGHKFKVSLAAPTGKAAARMQESIRSGVAALDCDESIKKKLRGLKGSTLHRLLGYKPNSVTFRHTENNPMDLDILVVDESSMIDSAMMAKLLNAVPPHAKVLLLGDKDQLPPVEPGSPFADICSQFGFSDSLEEKLEALSGVDFENTPSGKPLADNIVFLRHSFRFGANSGIGLLARAINNSDLDSAKQLLADSTHEDIDWQDYNAKDFRSYDSDTPDPLNTRILSGYANYMASLKACESVDSISKAFDTFCVLVTTNKGFNGLDAINKLSQRTLGFRSDKYWYHGRPIMITANNYQTKLFNGDVGLCLDMKRDGDLRVYFQSEDGFRDFTCSRIPEHQTAFAMTVHKSQGSEFDDVLFLLPDSNSKVLSKELMYTAITRAKQRVEVWGKQLDL
jgi:exodeoxyribonuclease V alpha subunit